MKKKVLTNSQVICFVCQVNPATTIIDSEGDTVSVCQGCVPLIRSFEEKHQVEKLINELYCANIHFATQLEVLKESYRKDLEAIVIPVKKGGRRGTKKA